MNVLYLIVGSLSVITSSIVLRVLWRARNDDLRYLFGYRTGGWNGTIVLHEANGQKHILNKADKHANVHFKSAVCDMTICGATSYMPFIYIAERGARQDEKERCIGFFLTVPERHRQDCRVTFERSIEPGNCFRIEISDAIAGMGLRASSNGAGNILVDELIVNRC